MLFCSWSPTEAYHGQNCLVVYLPENGKPPRGGFSPDKMYKYLDELLFTDIERIIPSGALSIYLNSVAQRYRSPKLGRSTSDLGWGGHPVGTSAYGPSIYFDSIAPSIFAIIIIISI